MKWPWILFLLADASQIDKLLMSQPGARFGVTLSLPAPTLSPGSSLVATARVRNHGQPIVYDESCHTTDGIAFSVKRDTVTTHMLKLNPCEEHCCTYLAAWDSVVVTVVLDGKLPLDRSAPNRTYMPAGDYTVRASMAGSPNVDATKGVATMFVNRDVEAVFHWAGVEPDSANRR